MDEREQLLSLHATVVETACSSETKRQSVSVASAGLISAGVAVFAADKEFSFIYLTMPLLIVSSIWFVTVRFYQQIAIAKWQVIHEIEDSLAYQPFKREWHLYKQHKGPFTFGPSTLEQVIPAIIFLATAVYGIYWSVSFLCRNA